MAPMMSLQSAAAASMLRCSRHRLSIMWIAGCGDSCNCINHRNLCQSKGFVVRNRAFYFFPFAHEHLKTSKGCSGYFVLKTGIFIHLDAYKLGVHSFLPDFQIIFILKYRCNKSALQICCQQMLALPFCHNIKQKFFDFGQQFVCIVAMR